MRALFLLALPDCLPKLLTLVVLRNPSDPAQSRLERLALRSVVRAGFVSMWVYSAIGSKRTFVCAGVMSANDPNRTFGLAASVGPK